MKDSYLQKSCLKEGIVAALPIVAGYVPIAMAFGILSKTNGIHLTYSFLLSAFVYAGASQFMALNLLSSGTGYIGIIITTLLVNFRHFLMSASMAAKLTEHKKKYKPIIAFGITDEVFSVASFSGKEITTEFLLPLEIMAYLSWLLGTILGYLVGQLLPSVLQNSMGIALYAMFAAILMPQIRKSKQVSILVCFSAILNTAISHINLLPQGWSFIITIILVSAAGTFIFDKGDEDCE
ncbi:MAG: azlC1 [Clostridiaceae bacterium]|jgi:4-azaleucine resistance transporter AzlC|nr:azlC1 [Clostridiaceae bacterium]